MRNIIIFYVSFFVFLNEALAENLIRFPSTYKAEITVSVKDGDFVKARKTAVALAMKDTLKQALKHILGEPKKTLNEYNREQIISKAQRYVKSYNFLYAEDNLNDMREEVGLEVTLYLNALRKNLRSLGLLSKPKSMGSILILIREIGFSPSQATSFWDYVPISETALTQKFIEVGLPVIPRSALKELVTEELILRSIQGDLVAALEIGSQVGAEIIILGNAATSKSKSFDTDTYATVQANVSVKTISVPKGMVVAAKSDFASARGESLFEAELQAYEEASIRLSDFLLKSLKSLNEKPISSPSIRSSGSSPLPLTPTDL